MCRNGTNAAGMQTLAGGAVPLGTNVTTEPRFRTIGRAGRASAISPAGAFSPMKPGRASRMNSETKHWQSIDTAPADRDILIYVAALANGRRACSARCRSPRRRIARPIGCRCPSHRQLAPPTSPSTIASPSPAPARRRRSRGAENPALISLRQHEVRPPRRRLGSVDEYRTLVPTLVLAAAVAANEPPPQAEPQATGATNERAAVNELRPAQDLRPQEKRPAVRVILPSPYATSR